MPARWRQAFACVRAGLTAIQLLCIVGRSDQRYSFNPTILIFKVLRAQLNVCDNLSHVQHLSAALHNKRRMSCRGLAA